MAASVIGVFTGAVTTSGATTTVTISGVQPGDLLVAVHFSVASSGLATSVSGCGATWMKAPAQPGSFGAAFWVGRAPTADGEVAATGGTTYSASAPGMLRVYVVRGAHAYSFGTSQVGSAAVASLPANPGAVVFAAGYSDTSTNVLVATNPADWTKEAMTAFTGSRFGQSAYRLVVEEVATTHTVQTNRNGGNGVSTMLVLWETPTPTGESALLITTTDASHGSVVRTTEALELLGIAVTVSLSTQAALDAVWATDAFDLIMTVRLGTSSDISPWVSAKWVAGTPVLVGGAGETGQAQVGYELGATPPIQNRLSGDGRENESLWVVGSHEVLAGYTDKVRVLAERDHAAYIYSDAYLGTKLGGHHGVTDTYMTAVEVGDILNALPASSPGRSAPTRLVFCGWLYGEKKYTPDGLSILRRTIDWLTSVPTPKTQAPVATALAAMTSDTTPTPQVAAASGVYSDSAAYKAFDKDDATGWSVNASTGFLSLDLGAETEVIAYRVRCGAGSFTPNAWTFEGSLDGTTWVALHAFKTGRGSGDWRLYLPGAAAYRYYRLNFTESASGAYLQVHEFDLLALDTATPSTAYWWDGTAALDAAIEGWWDGATVQPIELLGWWDGSAVQPISGG